MTGDFNPMHMDPVFARRTQAGAPVVHGMNSLLWLINAIAKRFPEISAKAAFKVRFSRIIYVGNEVEARIVEQSNTVLRAQIVSDGAVAVEMHVAFNPTAAEPPPAIADKDTLDPPAQPAERTIEDMENWQGYVAFARPPDALACVFPDAARWLGPRAPAALGCSSMLVGMIVPGLHSLYGSVGFAVCEDLDPSDRLRFHVTSILPRFSRVRTQIHGGGIVGLVEAFVRRAPTKQPALETLSSLVTKNAFAGAEALVIGGSRGLGELTANLLAAGGARVTITYAIGGAEAEDVASRIRAAGGSCKTMHFDVRQKASGQLEQLQLAPTHVYYFATPAIFRQRNHLFSQSLFDEFNTFYVSGFHALVQACVRKRLDGVSFFYPSTVAVDAPPANLLEYAMSKAAGELLCSGIAAHNRKIRIIVSRLPRLPTDQTATLLPVHAENPVQIMLPLIRSVQEPPA
jgi:hypothetical protein